MDLVDGQCICCWWREGEARFKPHWMDEGVWRRGVKYNWQLSDADARKLERGKKRG